MLDDAPGRGKTAGSGHVGNVTRTANQRPAAVSFTATNSGSFAMFSAIRRA